MTRRINALEERLILRSQHSRAVGTWRVSTVFYTDCAEQVELHSHEILKERLDTVAPLGEVFCCTASEAVATVELALKQLGLLHLARREGLELTGDDVTPIARREN